MTYSDRLINTNEYYLVAAVDQNNDPELPIVNGEYGEGIYLYPTPQLAKKYVEVDSNINQRQYALWRFTFHPFANINVPADTFALCVYLRQNVTIEYLKNKQWENETNSILQWNKKRQGNKPMNSITQADIVIGPINCIRLRYYLLGTFTSMFRKIKNMFLKSLYANLHFTRITSLRKNVKYCIFFGNENSLLSILKNIDVIEGPTDIWELI